MNRVMYYCKCGFIFEDIFHIIIILINVKYQLVKNVLNMIENNNMADQSSLNKNFLKLKLLKMI